MYLILPLITATETTTTIYSTSKLYIIAMNNYSSTDDAHFIVTDESKGLIQTLFCDRLLK